MAYSSDRNLLVGILALQMDFITRDQLIAGMNAWLLQKSRPLEEILFEQRALSADTLALLQALVNKHLEIHGNDPQQSLQALSSIEDLRDELQALADPEVQKTLRFVARSTARIPAEPERFTREIDALCDKFSAALRAGQQPKIEEYLPLLPERAQNELLVELLCEELDWRRRGGEPVEPAEYEARFPGQHAQVARAFQMRSDGRLDSLDVAVGRPSGVRERSKGRFRVIRPHAKGGLGEVFVARDTELNREVALKEIQRKYSDLEESRSRFLLEAEVTGALEHPGIVPVYGLGQYADGRPFYAMRFIKGDSLNEAIAQFHRQHAGARELTTGEVGVEFRKLLGRFIDVCEAIEYAHSRGVLHRDLKPGNIMLGKYGETLVVDWGLAKVVGRGEQHRQEGETTIAPDQGSGSAPTQGAIGTPVYMSPEQAAGRVADLGPATDIYSLGATLYHVLTGRAPFFGNSTDEILRRVQAGDYVKPRVLVSQPNSRETKSQPPEAATVRVIPASLEAICVKAMSLRQEDRYLSAAALAADVERFLADEPVSAMKEPVIERARRWVNRHKTLVSSMAGAMSMGLVSFAILAAMMSLKNIELRRANDQSRRSNYAGDMNLAQKAWESGLPQTTRELLSRYGSPNESQDLRGFEWYFLDRITNSELDRFRIESPGESIAFSHDGTLLAAGSYRNIIVWDVAAHEVIASLKSNDGSVNDLAFGPDDTTLASCHGKNILIWQTKDWQVIKRLIGHKKNVTGIEFGKDGKCLASVDHDAQVKIWNANSWEEVNSFSSGFVSLKYLTLSSDGKLLATSGIDGVIRICDMIEGKIIKTLPGLCAVFHPNGNVVLVSNSDGSVTIWNVQKWQAETHLYSDTQQPLVRIAINLNGTLLASLAVDKTIRLWDLNNNSQIEVFKGHDERVKQVLFSPDNARLASCDGVEVKLWSLSITCPVLSIRGHENGVRCMSTSSDGTHVVYAEKSKVIQRDLNTLQEDVINGVDTDRCTAVAYDSGAGLLVTADEDGFIKITQASIGQVSLTIKAHKSRITGLAFCPTRGVLASGSWDGILKLWNPITGHSLALLRDDPSKEPPIDTMAFSADGHYLASGSDDGSIAVWSLDSNRKIWVHRAHSKRVNSVAFSPNGNVIATASDDRTVKIWQLRNAQEVFTLSHHSDRVTGVAFSPDGTRLASVSQDRSAKLWDMYTGLQTSEISGHTADRGFGSHVAFSPDGTRLVVSERGGAVLVRDARPATPSLRAEQHAWALLASLISRVESKQELIEAVESSKTFDRVSRNAALVMASDFWDRKCRRR